MRSNALAVTGLVFAVAAPCQTFFPPPPTPTANPMTTEKALLGMALFWEEQLSANNSVACGSCHGFATGGTDSRSAGVHPGPDGIFGTADDIRGSHGVPERNAQGNYVATAHGLDAQVTPRKAPSMVNIAYQDRMFYDGRARDGEFRDPVTNQVMATGSVALENLILQPPLNPVEMGQAGRTWQHVASKIAAAQPLRLADQLPPRLAFFVGNQSYPQLFQRAYGTPEVTPTRIVFAIATYIRTLVSDQSKFDFVLAGSGVLTPEEAHGRTLFDQGASPMGAAACRQCHGDVSTTSHQRGPSAQVTTMYGQTPTGNFHNVGIRPIHEDPGAGAVTNVQTDNGRFKVPMLRNVGLHQTFGHNGQFNTLMEVVEFYDRGGDFHVNQAPEVQPRNMTQAERDAVVAFLNTLTDPRVQNGIEPFDSPRLGHQTAAMRPLEFGLPSAGSAGDPVMVASEPVFLGTQQATLAVGDVRPNALTALLWDLTAAPNGINWFGPTFYVGLTNPVLVVTGMSQVAPDGSGYASTTFAIPANPQLSGAQAYAQWLVLDPAATGGMAASTAIEIGL